MIEMAVTSATQIYVVGVSLLTLESLSKNTLMY